MIEATTIGDRMHDPVTVKATYRRFAERECRGYSALYDTLAHAVAGDDVVVRFIAPDVALTQPIPGPPPGGPPPGPVGGPPPAAMAGGALAGLPGPCSSLLVLSVLVPWVR